MRFRQISVIVMIVVTLGFFSAYAQEREVKILMPKNGEEIFLNDNEPMPAEREVSGEIIGFTKDDIQQFKLRVNVSIKTDKWYPQGIARVKDDGTWKLRKAYFGGATHIVKATLKDKSGNELANSTVTVTLIQ
jgi:hypothetical protein